MRTLKNIRCWVAFDRQKRTVDIATGKLGLRWRNYHEVRRWVGEPEPLRDYYLGLSLTAETNCLCIDIDELLSEQEVIQIASELKKQVGHNDFSIEYSMSGNLHIFLRIQTKEIPKEFRRGRGQFKGYPAEFYAVGQSILLTEQWTAGTKPVYNLQRPVKWNSIANDCVCNTNDSESNAQHETNEQLYQTKKRNIFLDILHLFPSFYAQYLKNTFVEEHCANNDRIHLRRPGKDRGISATVFIDKGVVYNFSTNWPDIPHHQGITLAEFIANQEKISLRQFARRFYQYLKQTSRTLGIPIPRRKDKLYFTIKRKHYYQFLTALVLFHECTVDLETLRETLQTLTQHKISPVSLQKHLYELLRLNIVKRTRLPNIHKYKYQLTEKGKKIIYAILKINAVGVNYKKAKKEKNLTLPLDLGWNLLIFIMELHRDPDSKDSLAKIFKCDVLQDSEYSKPQGGWADPVPPHLTFVENGKQVVYKVRFWHWRLVVFWIRWHRRYAQGVFWRYGSLFDRIFGGVWTCDEDVVRDFRRLITHYWREAYMSSGSYRGYLFMLDEAICDLSRHAFGDLFFSVGDDQL